MGICTKMVNASKITNVLDENKRLNVRGEVYRRNDSCKENKRYPMVENIFRVQKMCILCSSNYLLKLMPIYDKVIALEEYSSVKKGLKKSSTSVKKQ